MTRRNVKVIQPGLVYVIEWDAGGDPAQETPSHSPVQPPANLPTPLVDLDDDPSLSGREKRRAKRDAKRNDKPPPELPGEPLEPSDHPVYVAYVYLPAAVRWMN